MIATHSAKSVIFLIAANAVLLELFVLIPIMMDMMTLLFASSGLCLVIANTFAFRFLCYRFRKLPRSQELESINQAIVNNVAEEPPNA